MSAPMDALSVLQAHVAEYEFDGEIAQAVDNVAAVIAERDALRAALSDYVRAIAYAGGGDKDLFMASIREADDKARAVLARVWGGA